MTTMAAPRLELAPLPVASLQRIVDLDNGDALVTYDQANNSLTMGLYLNRVCIPLDTFQGKMELTNGGSTMRLTVDKAGGPAKLEVNYYWCGYPRDGIIVEVHAFDGKGWSLVSRKDRT